LKFTPGKRRGRSALAASALLALCLAGTVIAPPRSAHGDEVTVYSGERSFIAARTAAGPALDRDIEPENDERIQSVSIDTEMVYRGRIGDYENSRTDKADYYDFPIDTYTSGLYVKCVSDPTVDVDLEFHEACNCTIAEYGLLTGTHEFIHTMEYGATVFRLRVFRKEGGSGAYTFIVTRSEFSPPRILSASLESAFVGRPWEQALDSREFDAGETVLFELVEGPDWLDISEDGILTGTAGAGDAGRNIPVTVRVVDSRSLEDIWSTTIDVVTEIAPPSNVLVGDAGDDHGHSVDLSWELSPEDGYLTRYDIYRSRQSVFTDPVSIESFTTVEELVAAEQERAVLVASVQAGTESYTDRSLPLAGAVYYYWLTAANDDGESEKIAARPPGSPTAVEDAPTGFRVFPAVPNPFNPATTVRFVIPEEARVSLTVYDILGRRIAVLRDGVLQSGTHEAVWNGTDDSGATVAGGIYLYRVAAGDMTARGKVTFLK